LRKALAEVLDNLIRPEVLKILREYNGSPSDDEKVEVMLSDRSAKQCVLTVLTGPNRESPIC
jgi:hypothetical protein